MIMDLEKVIDKELERLGYDIEGSKTADFTDGFVRGYNYAQGQVKNCSIPLVSNCECCEGTGYVEGEHYDDVQACLTCNGSGC